MKNTKRLFGIIAIIAIIALSMTACDTGDGNGIGTGNGDNGNYLIKGQFANQEAGVNATFYANTASSRSARSAAASEALTGKIEDGQIIFNLTGVYFPENGSFILSAGSSFLIYEIAGTVTSTGLSDTQATVKVNNSSTGGDWTTFQINVTTADEVSITGSASNEQEDGIPSSWLGNWIHRQYYPEFYYPCEICDDTYGCDGHRTDEYTDITMVITQFRVLYIDRDDGRTVPYFDIFEVARVNNTAYDLVINAGAAVGCSDYPDCNHPECHEPVVLYGKIRLDQPSANRLTLELYWESINESLAFVRAFDTSTATLEGNIMEFIR